MKNTSATSSTQLTPEQRFKKLVGKADPKTGCKLWLGSCFANKYGRFCADGISYYAHRYAFQLAHGPIPAEKYVLHGCDNPRCCNVRHLRLGDAKMNAADRDSRNRGTKGRSIARHRFTEQEISRIVDMAAKGATQYRIAKTLDRTEPTITRVLQRNADAISLKRIRLQFVDALEALNAHIAPSIAALSDLAA